jgi:hypothetical protein
MLPGAGPARDGAEYAGSQSSSDADAGGGRGAALLSKLRRY